MIMIPISSTWVFPRRSFVDRVRGLFGMPQRANRSEWKSWRASRRELRGRNTSLPFTRVPNTEHVPDQNRADVIAQTDRLNRDRLASIAEVAEHSHIPGAYQQVLLRLEDPDYVPPEPTRAVFAKTVTDDITNID
jgi:hypothetical protein